MPLQELQNQIEVLQKQVKELNRIAIQLQMEATTVLYLNKAITPYLATYPTQTYSTGSPTGTAPVGSLWLESTGTVATSKIHVYSGSVWERIK